MERGVVTDGAVWAPSKVNWLERVPTTRSAVTPTTLSGPTLPLATVRQTSDVFDAHAAVTQSLY